MIDYPTLLFALACILFIAAWCAFFFGMASAFAEGMGAPDDNTDGRALIVAICCILMSGVLHWHIGTWGWFAWPWAIVAVSLALLIALSSFVLWFRIAAPAFLIVVSAALLFPFFF